MFIEEGCNFISKNSFKNLDDYRGKANGSVVTSFAFAAFLNIGVTLAHFQRPGTDQSCRDLLKSNFKSNTSSS